MTKNSYELQYLDLLSKIVNTGTYSSNRTGVNTFKIWGAQLHVDLNEGFPLLTTKKMHWKSVVHELLWMISGNTNIKYLLDNGVTFWLEWPYKAYKTYWDKNGCEMSVEGREIGICEKDLEGNYSCRSNRLFTQKEFEDKVRSDLSFSNRFGSIGRYGYGRMWRRYPVADSADSLVDVDQLSDVINTLKTNPDSRRIIMSAWHPYYSNKIEHTLLPACHNYIQFGTEEIPFFDRCDMYAKKYPEECTNVLSSGYNVGKSDIPKYKLNCYFSMRSSDAPLGLPYNIAFYALLTHLVAHCVNMIPNKLVYSGADVHIYENQKTGIEEQLHRIPLELPKLVINPSCPKNIFEIKSTDVEIANYKHQKHISMPVSV